MPKRASGGQAETVGPAVAARLGSLDVCRRMVMDVEVCRVQGRPAPKLCRSTSARRPQRMTDRRPWGTTQATAGASQGGRGRPGGRWWRHGRWGRTGRVCGRGGRWHCRRGGSWVHGAGLGAVCELGRGVLGRGDRRDRAAVEDGVRRTVRRPRAVCSDRLRDRRRQPRAPRPAGLRAARTRPADGRFARVDQRGPVDGWVVAWHDDAGWGVLASPELDGEVWAHETNAPSSLRRPLPTGLPVQFSFEHPGPDGYSYQAIWITPR